GRSEGAYIDFTVKDSDKKIRVFTTRIDTIFGATAIVLSSEHPLIDELLDASPLKDEVTAFAFKVKSDKATRGHIADEEEQKEGTNTGVLAINAVSGESITGWAANYAV